MMEKNGFDASNVVFFSNYSSETAISPRNTEKCPVDHRDRFGSKRGKTNYFIITLYMPNRSLVWTKDFLSSKISEIDPS